MITGTGVHDRPDSAFKINWTGCSRSNGIGVHDRPEHASRPFYFRNRLSNAGPRSRTAVRSRSASAEARVPAWSRYGGNAPTADVPRLRRVLDSRAPPLKPRCRKSNASSSAFASERTPGPMATIGVDGLCSPDACSIEMSTRLPTTWRMARRVGSSTLKIRYCSGRCSREAFRGISEGIERPRAFVAPSAKLLGMAVLAALVLTEMAVMMIASRRSRRGPSCSGSACRKSRSGEVQIRELGP